MKVILFGAGASYGGGDIVPERPPLGSEVYNELTRCYPRSWGAFPPTVSQTFKDNFEAGMQVLWDKYSEVVPELMQQMALYFIQFRPRAPGTTLYCALTNEIKRNGITDNVLLSTLNYECVLERAISLQGLVVNYGDFPATLDSITVWKLHGSCNMLPQGISATRGVRFTRGVTFNTAVRVISDLNEAVAYCLGDNALPPVMCLFMKGKPSQVSPGTIVAIQEAWRTLVARAEKVAIVGVHPNEEDAHLWDALGNTPASLLYIGDARAFENWCDKNRRNKPFEVIGTEFEKGFDRLVAEIVR